MFCSEPKGLGVAALGHPVVEEVLVMAQEHLL